MFRDTLPALENFTLLNETEAARFLGFTNRALQGWRGNGRGPQFVKVSARGVRYRLCDLMNWSEERIKKSTSDTCAVMPTDQLSKKCTKLRKGQS